MRPLWKGSISFGLVNIPVRLFAGTERKGISFRTLHDKCHTPLQYKKFCPNCEREVEYEEIVKGYEYEKDRFVIIMDEDLERIPDETGKTIDIVDFVELSEIDPVFYDRSYYLAPGETGEKAYTLLQSAMNDSGKIAIARLVIRSKQTLATVRGFSDILILETMFYPDEVRNITELPSWNRKIKINDNEMKMARELIENLTSPFEPEKYTDEYREALLEIIRGKIAGEEVTIVEAPGRGRVVDLVEALKASVDATRKDDGEKKEGKKRRRASKVGTA